MLPASFKQVIKCKLYVESNALGFPVCFWIHLLVNLRLVSKQSGSGMLKRRLHSLPYSLRKGV